MSNKPYHWYQFIRDRLSTRPYNEHHKKDGNYNYIHQTDAFVIVEEVEKLQCKVKELKNKLEHYKGKSIVTGGLLHRIAYCAECLKRDGIQLTIDDDYILIFNSDKSANELNCDECGKVIETIVDGGS